MRQLGQFLQLLIRKRDTLARLGGDEFAILLENCSLQQAERVANVICESLQDFRFTWENNVFNIGASIGLVPLDQTDETIDDVMRRVDAACYHAKESGRNRVHIYILGDEELAQREGEMRWVTRINSALEQDRLQLWSQKIVSLDNSGEDGDHYELLIRLIDEKGNTVLPGTFLPAAERYNLITQIDKWVISNIMMWFTRNTEKYNNLKLCSINISAQSLGNEGFLQEIIANFEKFGLAPEKFCFEVTETAAISNLNSATQFIKSLKGLGCSFALDDFGKGLSSFGYLKNLPVDFIKIDGMFVEDILEDPVHLALVNSINEVGHMMGKKTIAEFVEKEEILAVIKKLGVDYGQGYGISKPRLLFEGMKGGQVIELHKAIGK